MTIDRPVSDLLPHPTSWSSTRSFRAQLPKLISRFSSSWASLRDKKTHHYGTDGGRGRAVFLTRGGGSVSFLFLTKTSGFSCSPSPARASLAHTTLRGVRHTSFQFFDRSPPLLSFSFLVGGSPLRPGVVQTLTRIFDFFDKSSALFSLFCFRVPFHSRTPGSPWLMMMI